MLILASGSPRRAKILSAQGVEYRVVKSNAAEVAYPGDPERTVRENALAKASGMERPVLAADTIVWCEGKIYGKPKDLAEAKEFLRELSGRTHQVYTGVAYNDETAVETSNVTFKRLSEKEIDDYVELVKPVDRAGAYDIDDYGPLVIDRFDGEYENIMGLPLAPLRRWGVIGHDDADIRRPDSLAE